MKQAAVAATHSILEKEVEYRYLEKYVVIMPMTYVSKRKHSPFRGPGALGPKSKELNRKHCKRSMHRRMPFRRDITAEHALGFFDAFGFAHVNKTTGRMIVTLDKMILCQVQVNIHHRKLSFAV